jgi:NADPH2:quinone reductase
MRAVALNAHGGPEVLTACEMPEPELRPHDVLVEVHATSVNPVDTKIRQGSPVPRAFPLVLGYDVSGVVVRCGAAVSAWATGDEVFATANLFRNGANAAYVAIDARSAARKPAKVDHATAAALPLVSQTAWESLHLRARVRRGDTVFVQGGAGGVGHIAVQLARLHGCRVLATAGRDASVAFCRDVLRADEVIDYRTSDVVARVNELTGGRGVPAVLDTVGGDVFLQSLDCAAVNGHAVTIVGAGTGDRGPGLLYRNVTVHYEFMGIPTAYEIEPDRPARILQEIAALVDEGRLLPHVSQQVPLERLAEAHTQVETGHTIGKVVVTVAGGGAHG